MTEACKCLRLANDFYPPRITGAFYCLDCGERATPACEFCGSSETAISHESLAYICRKRSPGALGWPKVNANEWCGDYHWDGIDR